MAYVVELCDGLNPFFHVAFSVLCWLVLNHLGIRLHLGYHKAQSLGHYCSYCRPILMTLPVTVVPR